MTGFAYLQYDTDTKPTLLDHGSVKFPLNKKAAHEGQRYLGAITAYDELISRRPIDLIAYENVVRHSSSQAGHLFGFYKHTMLALAALHDVPVVGYVPTEWKKITCGRGMAGKPEVAGVASRYFPSAVWASDDESDAVCIGLAYWFQIKL